MVFSILILITLTVLNHSKKKKKLWRCWWKIDRLLILVFLTFLYFKFINNRKIIVSICNLTHPSFWPTISFQIIGHWSHALFHASDYLSPMVKWLRPLFNGPYHGWEVTAPTLSISENPSHPIFGIWISICEDSVKAGVWLFHVAKKKKGYMKTGEVIKDA